MCTVIYINRSSNIHNRPMLQKSETTAGGKKCLLEAIFNLALHFFPGLKLIEQLTDKSFISTRGLVSFHFLTN